MSEPKAAPAQGRKWTTTYNDNLNCWSILGPPDNDGSAELIGTAIRQAHATLIAAAPELAEALTNLLAIYEACWRRGDAISDVDVEASEAARAALRKAGITP